MESLEHEALQWNKHKSCASEHSTSATELWGHMAYTARQASYHCWLKAKFHHLWTSPKKTTKVVTHITAAEDLTAMSDLDKDLDENNAEKGGRDNAGKRGSDADNDSDDDEALRASFDNSDNNLHI